MRNNNDYVAVCVYTGNTEALQHMQRVWPSTVVLPDSNNVQTVYMIRAHSESVSKHLAAIQEIESADPSFFDS